jgi:hypothetical protein
MSSHTWFLVTGVLLLGACQEATAPGAALPSADVQFLAHALDATGAGLLDDMFLSGGPAASPAAVGRQSTSTTTFERTRPCPAGGSLSLAGTVTRDWDGEASTYDVEAAGTKSRTDCAFQREDVTITLSGIGSWAHERHFAEREPTGLWITTRAGGFDWARSTEETGDCTYELTRTVDTAENTVTLVGTFCGNEVDRSRTWRESTS